MKNSRSMLSGAQIILECLKEREVDTIFGYPGGSVIPLYDALYQYSDSFEHILTAHEQGAVHAADGYARVSGKTGVCFATSGPGATNTVTGLANAMLDSVPLVIITGNVTSPLLGRDSFQEVDITGITSTITKHSYFVEDISKLSYVINEAFSVANSGRKGPVLIDIPKDILCETCSFTKTKIKPERQDLGSRSKEISKALKLISSSKRPVLICGGGVISSDASSELIELTKLFSIPVVSTLMGLGGFPDDNNLFMGLGGMHGMESANNTLCESDLIIAVGTRFSDRFIGTGKDFLKKIIHIDIDETENGKKLKSEVFIHGNIASVLTKILELAKAERLENVILPKMRKTAKDLQGDLISMVNRIFPSDTTVATDVGQHQMWTAQHWSFLKPRSFLTSGGMGTMGFGLGAAIGGHYGKKSSKTLLITGDGSFRMNMNELITVSKYQVPVTILMLKNNSLGMVRQWQSIFCEKRFSQTTLTNDVDYCKLAQAFNIKSYYTDNPADLEKILNKIVKKNEPSFIEYELDRNSFVYPFVPPGESLTAMITE